MPCRRGLPGTSETPRRSLLVCASTSPPARSSLPARLSRVRTSACNANSLRTHRSGKRSAVKRQIGILHCPAVSAAVTEQPSCRCVLGDAGCCLIPTTACLSMCVRVLVCDSVYIADAFFQEQCRRNCAPLFCIVSGGMCSDLSFSSHVSTDRRSPGEGPSIGNLFRRRCSVVTKQCFSFVNAQQQLQMLPFYSASEEKNVPSCQCDFDVTLPPMTVPRFF